MLETKLLKQKITKWFWALPGWLCLWGFSAHPSLKHALPLCTAPQAWPCVALTPLPLLEPQDWDTASIFGRSWLTMSSLIHNYKIPSKSHSHLVSEISSLSILETSKSNFYAFMLDLIFINAKWSLHEAPLSHIKGMMPVSIHLVVKYQESPLIICFVLKTQQREIPLLHGHVP